APCDTHIFATQIPFLLSSEGDCISCFPWQLLARDLISKPLGTAVIS
ncbi:hypothetical protein LEMLEM_LOCUS19933, partial [Lemmus lemmus]